MHLSSEDGPSHDLEDTKQGDFAHVASNPNVQDVALAVRHDGEREFFIPHHLYTPLTYLFQPAWAARIRSAFLFRI